MRADRVPVTAASKQRHVPGTVLSALYLLLRQSSQDP